MNICAEDNSMLLSEITYVKYTDEVVTTPISISVEHDENEYAEDDENEDEYADDDEYAEDEEDEYLNEDGDPLETEEELNSRIEYWNTYYNTNLKKSDTHDYYKGMSETQIYFELK